MLNLNPNYQYYPTSSAGGERYVCDIETTAIGTTQVPEAIHSAVLIDIDTDEVYDYRLFIPEELAAFKKRYAEAKLIVGHNFIGFDHPKILEHYGIAKGKDQVIDTMTFGRLVFSDVKNVGPGGVGDFERYRPMSDWKKQVAIHARSKRPFTVPAPVCFPGQLLGAASLESWGERYGLEKKGDYAKMKAAEAKEKGITGKQAIQDYVWNTWNPEMHAYMIQDGVVNLVVFRKFMEELEARQHPKTGAKIEWQQSTYLTMRMQWIGAKMERNGYPLNIKDAEELYQELMERRELLKRELREVFPTKRVRLPDFIPKRDNKSIGRVAGVAEERWKDVEFNPTSRQQIVERFIEVYGWKPTEKNKDKVCEFTGETLTVGAWKMDDEILTNLAKRTGKDAIPEAAKLAELFMLQKRIGQIAEGNQAWLKKVGDDGRVHGRYNINATNGGRASHSSPNMGQVPGVRAPYGKRCRQLFHVPKHLGIQIGADQEGLELRCLGSFLCGMDNGAYIEEVLNGDIHWENAKVIFNLDPDLKREKDEDAPLYKKHKDWREDAKTFIYAMIYGAGDDKLGEIMGKGRREGAAARARMMKRFPALARLIAIVEAMSARGWLMGLDGRRLFVRKKNAALNILLQSAGYVICAAWLVLIEDLLDQAGFTEGWDGDYAWMAWIHDEGQWALLNQALGRKDEFKAIIAEAGRRAGEFFPAWRSPTASKADEGSNWADCH